MNMLSMLESEMAGGDELIPFDFVVCVGCELFGVTRMDLASVRRGRLPAVRWVVFAALRDLSGLRFTEIAELVGRGEAHYSGVLHGVSAARRRIPKALAEFEREVTRRWRERGEE
jgi:hypothetical protein